MATWLNEWNPEDQNFWETNGKKIAWKTLIITTISLVFSFATWFIMSTTSTKLNGIGFNFSDDQLFWLTALPGLAAGTLRMLHTFLIPIYGTRHVITIATLIKILPVLGLTIAVMNVNTPFWVFAVLSLMTGFGGGDFSSYMPSTNLFFPTRLKGTALGIQAGIGNFGVSLAQFITPILLTVGIIGSAQLLKTKDPITDTITSKEVFLQSPIVWYIPILIILGIFCWIFLKSIPIKASFKEQLDIFGDKHTWFCTITYFMTFGTFAGLSAAFPMMIKTLYQHFPEGPEPLKYAFYGPLIGSATRVIFGFVADKVGGAILTTITGIGLITCVVYLITNGLVSPTSVTQFNSFFWVMMAIFFFTGVGNAATFKQYPIIFKHNPRQAAGVIGWTAAIAAYGSFIFPKLIGTTIKSSKMTSDIASANTFFWGLSIFLIIATVINWWYYNRKGAERPS